MWSIVVWDKIKFFFPDNNNGSRVVVSTRQWYVASSVGTLLIPLKLLDTDKSWELFCQKAFPQQGYCPSDLEVFGKKIVKRCGGLPLLIVVIGALLRKSSRARGYWENISDNINSILSSGEEEIKSLDILCLSYRHLPAHLKPCFLYIVTFPKDHKLRVSRLIKFWIAEGFVRSNATQSLEEVARGYLKDLIDRNLLVLRTNRFGRRKTCEMHDLLRDLCLKIAEKENFLCVVRANGIRRQGLVDKGRRIVFEKGAFRDGMKSASPLTRSLIGQDHLGNLDSIELRLLRVLRFNDANQISKPLVNLRYYEMYDFPRDLSSMFLLWNLQTLNIKKIQKDLAAPPEVWEMAQLRHVNINTVLLPDPPLSSKQRGVVVLRNLQSLKTAYNLRLSEEVCNRVPNVKKLRLYYYSRSLSCDFGRLHKLESLQWFFYKRPNADDLLQSLTFPSSLRKSILSGCGLGWEDLNIIGSLPRLEVLKLEHQAVVGAEWNPVEGEFPRLQSLWIGYNDVKNWNADRFCFPLLEKLFLHGLWHLRIPSDFGEIPTLGLIELDRCGWYLTIQAMEILEEHESLGNEDLRLQIRFSSDEILRSFKREVQHMDCFTSASLELISPAY